MESRKMTTILSRAHGIDISEWEGYYRRVDNPPRPVDFAIARTGYGMVKDSKFDAMTPAVLEAPVTGVFHYWSSAAPWKQQADLFMELARGRFDIIAPDFEKAYNGQSLVNQVLPALEYLTKYSGKKVILYTNPDMWASWFYPIQNDLLKYELWVAHYWFRPNPEGTPNYFTIPGAANMRRYWRIWQYDCQGQGGRGQEYGVGAKGLDLNVYNGSPADMVAWAKGTTPPAPQPKPDWPAYVVTPLLINVRKEASASSTWLGFMTRGTVVTSDTELDGYSHFQPTKEYPKGGWVYSSFIKRVLL